MVDVVGIGSALVDVLAHVTQEFLDAQDGMVKGTMTLIKEREALALYDSLPPAIESSGGSVANTLAGLVSLGGTGAFFGKVADDQMGQIFTHDMRGTGVIFDIPPLIHGPATGRSLILITPDAQRTMNTYLGAACVLSPSDVQMDILKAAQIIYIEGYVFDSHAPRAAAFAMMEASPRVALALSDPLCVARHRMTFLDLLQGAQIEIVIANEREIMALYETNDLEEALARITCPIAAITRSEKGAIILKGSGARYDIAAVPDVNVVDTTGAGDQFAAGFLYGLTHGMDLPECARLGTIVAAEVISHIGARPEVSLAHLV